MYPATERYVVRFVGLRQEVVTRPIWVNWHSSKQPDLVIPRSDGRGRDARSPPMALLAKRQADCLLLQQAG